MADPGPRGATGPNSRNGTGREPSLSLWRIAVPAFGPTALASVGTGATLPVLALRARDLGASVSVAALVLVVMGVAELVAGLGAGRLVARVGERWALVGASLVEAAGGAVAWLATGLAVYFAGVVMLGATAAVFLLARMSYLAEQAPVHQRARAMSTLGGVTRIGLLVGPLAGAPLVARWGPRAAFALVVVASLSAALVAWRALDVTAGAPGDASGRPPVRTRDLMRRHRRVLLTVGVGVLLISAARAARVVAVPLWAEEVGLTAAQTSLVFGVAGGVEVLLFYPAGSVMDHLGRVWVAVPCAVVLGAGLLVLPLTTGLLEVGAVAVAMGAGNGLGSGIVMTLGADAAPAVGRTEFLGAWRLLSLLGSNGGPLAVSVLAAVASIAAACVVTGATVLAGGAWLARWLPEYDPRRHATEVRDQ